MACYRNKVVNYRQGIETDLSEVLQTDRIFTNVSKGEFANSADLEKAFGSVDEKEICRTILLKGQLQVSDMERSAHLENTLREIATMVCEKCVNPESNRPYTLDTIRDAMREAEFNVNLTRNTKQQFLDCVKLIKQKEVLPLERAKMKMCAYLPADEVESTQKCLVNAGVHILTSNDAERIEFLMDPGLYRDVDAIVKGKKGRLEILEQAVFEQGDVGLQSELARKDKLRLAEQHQHTKDTAQVPTLNVDNEEAHRVMEKLEHALHVNKHEDDDEEDSDENEDEDYNQVPLTKKQLKEKQKKSKKAKRREKEEAEERQKRIEKERVRQEERESRAPQIQQQTSTEVDKTKSCNTCGGSFTDSGYRTHFKSDWHRFNLKLKLQGVPCISEEEFKLCDADSFFH